MGLHWGGLVACLLTAVLLATPATAADPPRIDCGKGIEVLFCPLRVPAFIVEGQVFVATEFMQHAERVSYPVLDGINFYGQLITETADRVLLTERLIVDFTENLLPGVILARTVERAVYNVTSDGDSIAAPDTDIDALLLRQAPVRAKRPAVLDYGEAVK